MQYNLQLVNLIHTRALGKLLCQEPISTMTNIWEALKMYLPTFNK